MTIPVEHALALSILLFAIGVVGVIVRRNLVIMLLSIELMFNAAIVALVTLDRLHDGSLGHAFALVVTLVAVAEAAIALAVLAAWLRHRASLDVDDMSALKW